MSAALAPPTAARPRAWLRLLAPGLLAGGLLACCPREARADVDVRLIAGFGRSRLSAQRLPGVHLRARYFSLGYTF